MSTSLKGAMRQFDVLPAVSALVSDNPPEAPRLSELASVYASGSIPDCVFDGSFGGAAGEYAGRIYNDGGNMYAQVVTLASPSWGTFTLLDAGGANYAGAQQVAIALSQSDGTARAYWVSAGDRQINCAVYDGTSWGASGIVFTAGVGLTVTGLASCGMDPTPRVYFAIGADSLYETHWTGAVWTAPLSDGVGWGITPTIAVGFRPVSAPHGDGDAFLWIASGSPKTLTSKQFRITSGAGWGASGVVLTTGVGTGYSYGYPHVSETRSDSLRQVMTWSEVAPAPIGTQAMVALTPTHASIQGAVPWRYGGAYGVKVFRDRSSAPRWWVMDAVRVYGCAADSADYTTGQRYAFAQEKIQGLRLETGKPNTRSIGQLTVLNEGGVLSGAGTAGLFRCLRPGSQVAVALGYRFAAGVETVWQLPMWVSQVMFHDEVARGQSLVTLKLVDAWAVLESLQFRSTVTYTGQTAEYLLQRVLWNVCGYLGAYNALLSSLVVSPFTFKGGESCAVAARRLCDLAGVDLVFRTNATSADGTGLDSVGVVAVARGVGGSVYSYGAGGTRHPIVQSEIATSSWPAFTGSQVGGLATVSVKRNWASTWASWRDQLERLVDKTLANQAATDAVSANRAGALLVEAAGESMEVLANVGQEVSDQVDVTIASAGLSNTVFTVSGITTTWQSDSGVTPGRAPAKGGLRQVLRLEGTQ